MQFNCKQFVIVNVVIIVVVITITILVIGYWVLWLWLLLFLLLVKNNDNKHFLRNKSTNFRLFMGPPNTLNRNTALVGNISSHLPYNLVGI